MPFPPKAVYKDEFGYLQMVLVFWEINIGPGVWSLTVILGAHCNRIHVLLKNPINFMKYNLLLLFCVRIFEIIFTCV